MIVFSTYSEMMNHVAMQHARRWEGDVVPDHGPVSRLVPQATSVPERRIVEIEICRLPAESDGLVDAFPGKPACTGADDVGLVVVLVEGVLGGDVGSVLEDDVDDRAVAERTLAVCGLSAGVVIPQQGRELLAECLVGPDVERPRAGASHVDEKFEGAV